MCISKSVCNYNWRRVCLYCYGNRTSWRFVCAFFFLFFFAYIDERKGEWVCVTHAAVNVWHWSARLPVREWILLKDKLISTSLAWKDKLRFWQGVFTGTHRDSLILRNYRYFKALLNEKWNTYLLPVDVATWFVEHKSKITGSDEGKKSNMLLICINLHSHCKYF